MATYVPNPTDSTQPTEDKFVESAAAEFRALKGHVTDEVERLEDELEQIQDEIDNMAPGTALTSAAVADLFDGDGVTKDFILFRDPGKLANLDVSIGGAVQRPTLDYTWTSPGKLLHFVEPPIAGTDNILVRYTEGLPPESNGNLREDLEDTTSPSLGAAIIGRGDQMVSSIAELRLLLKSSNSKHASATGYYVPGDGGGGSFYLDESDTVSVDNGGTVIVAADGGRWKRPAEATINVRHFGVNPSVANNQSRFQAVADAAAALVQIQNNGSVFRASIPKVVTPPGVYTVTGAITIGSSYVDWDGTGARIEQTDPATDTFKVGDINDTTGAYVSGDAYLVTINGFIFFGGRRHIVLANNNVDSNQMRIERCQFFNAESYSVDITGVSGQVILDRCKWHNNWKIARLANDMKTFMDCWFDGSKAKTANSGQIINVGGTLYFYRIMGLPGAQLAARWVDDYTNHVQMFNCRWGDEGGNGGWPLIYAFGSPDYSTRYSPSIVIRDSYTGGGIAAGRTDYSLVFFKKAAVAPNRVPPIVIIDNMTKSSSVTAIGTDMTDAELDAAVALHAGLTYYSVKGVQTETYGLSMFMPLPMRRRSAKRNEIEVHSVVGGDQLFFLHYITKQLLTNIGNKLRITYVGRVANNAFAKALRVKLDGFTLPSATYLPQINTELTFFGELEVVIRAENAVYVTHKVEDGTGNKIMSVEYVGIRDFVLNEYTLAFYTDCGTVDDILFYTVSVEFVV